MGKSNIKSKYRAVDLFSGCGGLTEGIKRAGFNVISAVENDWLACNTYRANHPEIKLLEKDIRDIKGSDLLTNKFRKIHLLTGCPPCQGFSSIRRKNRKSSPRDRRNQLVSEFQRIVEEMLPPVVFLENVPGIENYHRFKEFLRTLKQLGYKVNCKTVDLCQYGVPQRRKRIVILAGLGFEIEFPRKSKVKTVRMTIGNLKPPHKHNNKLHNQVAVHSPLMLKRIKNTPHNGGSRADWPKNLKLECHSKTRGFHDVYGRMSWDEPAPTMTGGCVNLSKGRFLHPTQNREITLLEAAKFQTFRQNYYFSLERGRYPAAEMIGNALPPKFAEQIGRQVAKTLEENGIG